MYINMYKIFTVCHGNINAGESGEVRDNGNHIFVSGWSMKHAMRELLKKLHTHYNGLRSAAVEKMFPALDAKALKKVLMNDKNVEIYIAPSEIAYIEEAWKAFQEKKDKEIFTEILRKKITRCPSDAWDIAIFGRFFSVDDTFTSERCLSCSTPFSVNECAAQEQFFTATDDCEKGNAFFMSTEQFAPNAIFYWYAVLDTEKLFDSMHLSDLSPDEKREIVENCLLAAYYAMPNGKASSMYAKDLPRLFYIDVTKGMERGLLSGAFATKVKNSDQTELEVIRQFETYVHEFVEDTPWIRSVFSGKVFHLDGMKNETTIMKLIENVCDVVCS